MSPRTSPWARRVAAVSLALALAGGAAGSGAAAATSLRLGEADCAALGELAPTALTLMEAAARVVCRSPLRGQAVQLVHEQQAGVALAESAFRPRVNATVQAGRINLSGSDAGERSMALTAGLGLTWVLYDGGVRQAGLAQARWLRDSAAARQQAVGLAALNEALVLYLEAAAARSRLEAVRETERVAEQTLKAAQAKHEAQVGSLGERLQAQAALAQATLDRVRAEGAWRTARGLLALAMGLPPDHSVELAGLDQAFPDIEVPANDGAALLQAQQEHPRLQAERAEVQALRARLDAVRAGSSPQVSVGLSGTGVRDFTEPSGLVLRMSAYVQASVPLFNHQEQQARESQVQAQIGGREAQLEQVKRELAAELWRHAQALDAETQSVAAADQLLAAADRSYQVAFGRYKAGVGSVLELLSTQAALATARAQHVQSRLAMQLARLRLGVAAGSTLGL